MRLVSCELQLVDASFGKCNTSQKNTENLETHTYMSYIYIHIYTYIKDIVNCKYVKDIDLHL